MIWQRNLKRDLWGPVWLSVLFGFYSPHENRMLRSSPLYLSSFAFVLLLGPLWLREQVVKRGP